MACRNNKLKEEKDDKKEKPRLEPTFGKSLSTPTTRNCAKVLKLKPSCDNNTQKVSVLKLKKDKKEKYNLEPALRKPLPVPNSEKCAKMVKFKMCKNNKKHAADYELKELVDIYMRYIHWQNRHCNRRKLRLSETFSTVFENYGEWWGKYLKENEKN